MIHKAPYGASGSFVDLAAVLTKRIVKDHLQVTVANELAIEAGSKDPCEGTVKTLVVYYSLDGQNKEKTATEGQTLVLP